MILVTSANGNQGRILVRKIVTAGCRVRALVQSETSARELERAGAQEVMVGDLSHPDVRTRAVAGISKVYHIGPTLNPKEYEIGIGLVDAATDARVDHFVMSSVIHAIASDLIQHEIKRDIEEHLLKSGLEYTILQPCNYMLPLKLRPAFTEGVFKLSWSLEQRQSLVDLHDVADVAVEILTNTTKHAGATYELVGEGRYTAYDLADMLSKVIGHKIQAQQIDPDVYFKAWFGDDAFEDRAHELHALRAITAHYSAYDFIGNPNVLRWLLGRAPTSFEAFAAREYDAFRRGNAG